jgi:hypothetical protein
MAVTIVAGLAHHGDDLINGRRVGGIALALFARGYPGAEAWRGRRRAASTRSVKQRLNRKTLWLLSELDDYAPSSTDRTLSQPRKRTATR